MIEGKIINLRAVEKADLPKIFQWHNDAEVMQYWGRRGNSVSLGEVENWYQELIKRRDDRETYWMIETKQGVTIGRIFYRGLQQKDRQAEVVIMIGEKAYWGKGYGTDAMMTFLDYMFSQRNMHRIWLTVFAFNQRAIKSYQKCGFKLEGTAREDAFFDGRWQDHLHLGILQHEFQAPKTQAQQAARAS